MSVDLEPDDAVIDQRIDEIRRETLERLRNKPKPTEMDIEAMCRIEDIGAREKSEQDRRRLDLRDAIIARAFAVLVAAEIESDEPSLRQNLSRLLRDADEIAGTAYPELPATSGVCQ